MTGRPRKPVDLQIADKNVHITKEYIAEKKATELKVETKEISRPSFLPSECYEEFDKLSNRLLEIGIFTDLDEDLLSRYLIAKLDYVKYSTKLRTELKRKSVDFNLTKDIQNQQDKAFRQMRDCANDLGLSISSRVRLTLPKIEKEVLNDEL